LIAKKFFFKKSINLSVFKSMINKIMYQSFELKTIPFKPT